MTTISASLVKELREATGAGMMDCKRALEETGGDLEAARTLLREKGMAGAAKRADRSTPEGVVIFRGDGDKGTLVAIGCETEPVSKNDEFRAFAEKVADTVEAQGADAVSELDTERQELVGKLGENIQIVGASQFEGDTIAAYVHTPANKVGAMVKVRGGSPEQARDLAMHLTFARPRYLNREQVPAEEVEAERSVLAHQEDVASKPENVRDKIIEGRIQKWFAVMPGGVLLDQPWFREAGQTTQQAIGSMEVLDFAVYALGA